MPESAAPEALMAFDYGARRIGVAVGQRLTSTASPLEVVRNGEGGVDWDHIDALIEQWKPAALVVGIPIDDDGKVQPITRAARRFAGQLSERTRLPTHHADERYSSREADDRFRHLRGAGAVRRNAVARQDAYAAKLILEAWFGH